MKAKRQIESSLNSVTMLDGTGGQVTSTLRPDSTCFTAPIICASVCAPAHSLSPFVRPSIGRPMC
jgi:hypothetical protein